MSNPLLEQFILETRDQLDDASSALLALEKDPTDADCIDRAFRAVHSAKGASGLFDFAPLTRVLHAAEDLMDAVRDGRRQPDAELVDQVFDALDQVTHWIDHIERTEALPEDAPREGKRLAEALMAFLGAPSAEPGPAVEEAPPAAGDGGAGPDSGDADGADVEPLDWAGSVADSVRRELVAAMLGNGIAVQAVEYEPDEGAFFRGEDPLLFLRQLEPLQALVIAEPEAWGPPDEVDPFTCRLAFRALTTAPEGLLREHFAYVADQVRIREVAPEALVVPVGERGDPSLYADFVAHARDRLAADDAAAIADAMRPLRELSAPELREASLLDWLQLAIDEGRTDWLAPLLDALADGDEPRLGATGPVAEDGDAAPGEGLAADGGGPPETLPEPAGGGGHPAPAPEATTHAAVARELIGVQREVLTAAGDAAGLPGRLRAVATVLRRTLDALDQPARGIDEALEAALADGEPGPLLALLDALPAGVEARPAPSQPVPRPDAPPVTQAAPAAPSAGDEPGDDAGRAPRSVPRTLKVDQESIDALGDLIGELVVAKNALPFLARRAEEQYGTRELSRELKESFNVINRIVQEMQGSIMQVQMLPLSQVFQRFPRLVRDLSRQVGKEVELIIEGEETEADKGVIELLTDPLTHMVRNSLDHGLEMPDTRTAAGKPACGTLQLSAWQDGESVYIELADDGAGIDVEAVKAKAYQRGLVDEQRLDSLSDDEARMLIFAPGFSTREQISDLSGRGVGMDVVRSTIDRIGGSVSLTSELGAGTRMRLQLPLTMAVSHIMGIWLAGQRFGIPMDAVAETVRIPESAVSRIKQREAFVLRDRIIPLVRLGRVLDMEAAGRVAAHAAGAECYDEPQVSVLVVRHNGELVGLMVDEFEEGLEVILKPLEGVLAGMPEYAGSGLLGDGSVLLVLNLPELL